MKKFTILIAALALVCFAVPAMAVDWNFYGSARINTWYVSTDLGDQGLATTGDDGDSEVRWGFNGQTNSRIGARVKAENVSGRFELQFKGNGDGDPGSAVTVESRILYGEWNFGSGKMKIGKDYTPVSQFVSGQVFDEDLGLLGFGTQYGNRTPQMAFSFGGFNIALIEPKQSDISTLTVTTTTVQGNTWVSAADGAATGGDIDSYIPKIEASWGMSFDAWNFSLQGGYQYYSISDVVSLDNGSTNDIGVTSYTIGGNAGFNFGPAYVKGALSYGQNWQQAAWGLNGLATFGSPAAWDGDDSTDDTTTFQGALVGGLKVSDMMSFEGGFGYRQDDFDVSGSDTDKAWAVYVQSVIALAPGVYVVPEIGYYDYMDDPLGNDEGNLFYIGGKWQIDF